MPKNKACGNCTHIDICSIYPQVVRIVNQLSESPFKAFEVANICYKYEPNGK
ncbi:MAG: hypothetical protein HY929_00365 [Euryarchaeota archaeon]|nr:hypothetical protein [Euryarchaeota archaeon]